MTKEIKISLVLVVLVAVIFGYKALRPAEEINTVEADSSFENFDMNETVDNTLGITMQVLTALSNFYMASQKDIAYAQDNMFSITSNLMEQNRYLKYGIDGLSDLTTHKNELVNLIGKGMSTGAMELSIANGELLNIIKTIDETGADDFSYQLAEYATKQKEGYRTIYISAGQIGYLLFRPAETDNPTGAIPYKISKQDRDDILEEIDSLFGDAFKEDEINYRKTQTHNAILSVVKTIRGFVEGDTYEEANALKN